MGVSGGDGQVLTCAAQNVARLLDVAMRTTPSVEKPTIRRNPSARPQISSSLAIGIYTADVMAFDTISMTVKSECDWKSLVTKGVKLARTEILNPLIKKMSQMLGNDS